METRVMRAICLGLVIVTSSAEAQSQADRRADREAIASGERAWGQAFVTGDTATVERLLAEDFIGVETDGHRYDKASVLKDVASGPRLTSDEIDSLVVRFYGDTAIAQADEHEIGPPPEKARLERTFTDTWVRIDGHWRIVAAEDLVPAR